MKRAIVSIALVAALVIAAGIFSAGVACAHDPRFACSPRDQRHPIVIADPKKSWAFYGKLARGQRDHYALVTPVPVDVAIQLLVDLRDADNPARPVATITGASHQPIATIDLKRTKRFDEPFSRVSYLESLDRVVRLPAGTSTILVGMGDGRDPQRYTLALGDEERFSALEIPYLLGALTRIHARWF